MGKYMSCEKMARCTLDECDPKTCEGYKYNHRRYNAFAKSVLVPMSDEALVAVGDKLVDARVTVQTADSILSVAKAKHKGISEEENEIIDNCVSVMKAKAEHIDKEVQECFDYITGQYSLKYKNEEDEIIVVEERELTDAEKQDEMDIVLKQVEEEEAKKLQAEAGDDDNKEPDDGIDLDEVKINAAVGFIHEHQTAKAVTLKRKMKISQAEADTLLDVLEALGYIGKVKENGEPRDILFDLKKPLSEILGSE